MSSMDFIPAHTTATSVRESSSRSAEMSKFLSAPRWAPPMPPVAKICIPASAATIIVAATVVAPSLPVAKNWSEIKSEIEANQKEIATIDEQLQDQSKVSESYYKEIEGKQKELHDLKSQKSDYEFNASQQITKKLQDKSNKVAELETSLKNIETKEKETNQSIQAKEQKIVNIDNEVLELRNQFSEVSGKTLKIDEHQFTCPTCMRAFEDADIEEKKVELENNFNINKANQLEEINKKGKGLKAEKLNLEKEVEALKSKNFTSEKESVKKAIEEAKKAPAGVETVQAILKNNQSYQEVVAQITSLEKEIETKQSQKPKTDSEALNQLKLQKTELSGKIDELKKALNKRTQIEQGNERISELNDQSKDLAQQLADLERDEYTINAFTHAKINAVEEKINQLFPTVKFKMFEEQINGGVSEVCETLINGVPFSDANNAAKIQTGIEIINVLSKHYDFHAPIFIDNAESVTTLPNTDSQAICLIVEKGTKELTIK